MIFNPMRYSSTTNTTKQIFTIPVHGGTLTYNGSVQSPAWNNYNTGYMSVSGQTSATDAGTYKVVFSLTDKENTLWSDYTNNDKEITWTIQKGTITHIPTEVIENQYDGSVLEPVWDMLEPSKYTISGTTSAINSGEYVMILTPTPNYQWADGTSASKEIIWHIAKGNPNIVVNPTRIDFTGGDGSQMEKITVTRSGNGAISARSGDETVVSVSIIGNEVSCVALNNGFGSAVITVAEDENHYTDTVYVPVTVTGATGGGTTPGFNNLDDISWSQIKEWSDSGTAANYVAVGDTKSITITTWPYPNGDNITLDVFIIGINHNANIEGNNRIHFQIGKMYGGESNEKRLTALTSNYYGTVSAEEAYNCMNVNSANVNITSNLHGYEGCNMRKETFGNGIAPTYLYSYQGALPGRLPDDLKRVMKSVTKYTDNVGFGHTYGVSASNVSATTEYMTLMSEYEYLGEIRYSNQYEVDKQEQYEYYKNGNERIHYQSQHMDQLAKVWTRSVATDTDTTFVCLSEHGEAGDLPANYSLGISPIFFV